VTRSSLREALAVHDAGCLNLAVQRKLSLATDDDKLTAAARAVGLRFSGPGFQRPLLTPACESGPHLPAVELRTKNALQFRIDLDV
jgi:hypothetical protein